MYCQDDVITLFDIMSDFSKSIRMSVLVGRTLESPVSQYLYYKHICTYQPDHFENAAASNTTLNKIF